MSDLACGQARRLAWGESDRLVLSVERARAQAHISRCPPCQRFVGAMRLFRRAVGTEGGAESAPAAFRERLRANIGAARLERTERRWRGRLALTLAAAVVLIALGARLYPAVERDPVRQIARRESALLTEPGIESSDRRVVQEWLAPRVPYRVHIPEFLDARLTGAAVPAVEGRQSAVLRFQVGDRHITYVISPAEPATGDTTLRSARVGGLAVVSWRAPGLLHVWIGAIPQAQLVSLARRCAEQASAAAALSAEPRRAPVRA